MGKPGYLWIMAFMIRLTRQQVRRVDELSTSRYGIPPMVLMENAARSAAQVAANMLHNPHAEIAIVCGGGNNGGDGLALARHLHNRGAKVSIWLACDPSAYRHEAMTNFQIIQAMQLNIHPADPVELAKQNPALWVDAIFGTGLTQPPREPFGSIVAAIHHTQQPILAIDLPSGLDCDTGTPLGPCIIAKQTVTFVAEKAGFATPEARRYLGKVSVGDIGCPIELIELVQKESPA